MELGVCFPSGSHNQRGVRHADRSLPGRNSASTASAGSTPNDLTSVGGASVNHSKEGSTAAGTAKAAVVCIRALVVSHHSVVLLWFRAVHNLVMVRAEPAVP